MTAAAPGPEQAPAPQRRWGLIVSLALNLLLAGLIAGGIWRLKHHHSRGIEGDAGLLGFVKELPAERQGGLRDQLMAERMKIQPLRAEIRATWAASNALLTAEPFEKEKFKAALGKSREANMRFQEAVSSVLAETAEKLTPEDRKRLQMWRDRHRPHQFGHRGRRNTGGDGKESSAPE